MCNLKKAVFEKDLNNTTLKASVSPCCWMHSNYGLQIKVWFEKGGNVFLKSEILFENATEQDVRSLLDTVKLSTCKNSGCDNLAFDPTAFETNREGQCETCFMKELRANLNSDLQEGLKQELVDAQEKKADGFNHVASIWIHPARGGEAVRR